jgi:predicted nucleic acid-binding protein
VAGLTLDSGALIGYERGDIVVIAYIEEALNRKTPPVVPAVVVAESYRGGARSARIARLLKFAVVEPLSEALARKAGVALGRRASAQTIDAIVVASAAARSDAILTADPVDLQVFADVYPAVLVISI